MNRLNKTEPAIFFFHFFDVFLASGGSPVRTYFNKLDLGSQKNHPYVVVQICRGWQKEQFMKIIWISV